MKTVTINGRFLCQPITGVQRTAIEVVRLLDEWTGQGRIDTSRVRFELLAPARGPILDIGLRELPVRRVGFLRGQAWEQFELPARRRSGLLLCFGTTAPAPTLLAGSAPIVVVQDLSCLDFPEAYRLSFRLFYRTLMPLVFRRAGRIVTVSMAERSRLLDRFPATAGRIGVVQNGAAPRPRSERPVESTAGKRPTESPYLLYVGSMSRRKNVQGVLRAFAILADRFERLELVLVGGQAGVFRQRDFAVPEQLRGRVHPLGQIDQTERLLDLYRGAACFVFPSFYEASPMPPMEAMACGCPVVASPIPPHLERFEDAPLYGDPERPDDIAAKVAAVLESNELADQLRARGYAQAAKHTWERCAERYLAILEEALDEPVLRRQRPVRAA